MLKSRKTSVLWTFQDRVLQKLSQVPAAHACNPSYLEGWDWEDRSSEARMGKQSAKSPLQNNQSKMNWRCGWNSRAPALQAQSPEFKPWFDNITTACLWLSDLRFEQGLGWN
jgi:hypothetical protein